ncbi:hypothetical protein [Sinomonas humi]|uniref:Uncharacterized protein n=1 Tax=Sinomonas humi TaxID=1338436 RepID=A0A0B2AMB4_9MICC|nr:hypothetical protein [Sinomonas humi]KHL04501.1 hypothetical protein LK10_05025 [Sinomonas humi]
MTDAPPTLRVVREGPRVRLAGPAAGPVPTATVEAGEWVRVEVDPTDVRAPVAVDILDLDAGDLDLRDLLGSPAVDLLADPGTGEIPFVPGPFWEALAACAFQRWTLHWNCFPLDPELMAVDRLAAAAGAGPFGLVTVREARPMALGALRRLSALERGGSLSPAAAHTVAAAAAAGPQPVQPELVGEDAADAGEDPADVETVVDSRLGYLRRGAPVAHTPYLSADGQVERLVDSPDWRLTGIGMASTAEDMILAAYTDASREEILIRVPIQGAEARPGAGTFDPADVPYYHGIITDAVEGEVLAFFPLAPNADGNAFEGRGPLARPLVPTDVLDIRHPDSAQTVQTDMAQRGVDRVRRCAARAFSVHRLRTVAEAGGAQEEVQGRLAETASLAWKETAQAAAALADFLASRDAGTAYALSWVKEARNRQRQALAESPLQWHRTSAKAIRVEPMPALQGQRTVPPTVAELDLAGALAVPQALSV